MFVFIKSRHILNPDLWGNLEKLLPKIIKSLIKNKNLFIEPSLA